MVERFSGERRIRQVSKPNKCRLISRELYAILHMVFAETEIMVHIHKKYYLSIACAWDGSEGLELGETRVLS